MRLISFEHQGERFGALREGNCIADLTNHCGEGVRDLASTLGRHGLARLAEIASAQSSANTLEDVKLLPPVPRPGKIICVGLNYRSHIAETGL